MWRGKDQRERELRELRERERELTEWILIHLKSDASFVQYSGHDEAAGINPMNDLQACTQGCKFKSFLGSLEASSAVKFNPLKLVFDFKFKVL